MAGFWRVAAVIDLTGGIASLVLLKGGSTFWLAVFFGAVVFCGVVIFAGAMVAAVVCCAVTAGVVCTSIFDCGNCVKLILVHVQAEVLSRWFLRRVIFWWFRFDFLDNTNP